MLSHLQFIAKYSHVTLVSLQDEGSEVEVKVDGTPLKKNQETKLGVGQTISYGGTEYKVHHLEILKHRREEMLCLEVVHGA